MEVLPPRLTLKAGLWQQAALAGLLLLALLFAPGCTLDQYWTSKDGPPKAGHPCQIVTTWMNEVQYAPDVVHDGVPTPGLVGRVYLFGPAIDFPQVGDGGLVVDLYNDTAGPATQPLERWQIDPVTLQKFLKKDIVGWGYTLFLPWPTCRPDVTKVHLTVRYDPAGGGSPLWAQTSLVTIEHPPAPGGPGAGGLATAMAK